MERQRTNSFPQEGLGFTYEFGNQSLNIKGNLAISKDLGSIVLDEEEVKVQILQGIYLKCLKKNWYLSTEKSFSYEQIAQMGGVCNAYTDVKQSLIRVRDFLIEHHKESLIKNYINKLHGKL